MDFIDQVELAQYSYGLRFRPMYKDDMLKGVYGNRAETAVALILHPREDILDYQDLVSKGEVRELFRRVYGRLVVPHPNGYALSSSYNCSITL